MVLGESFKPFAPTKEKPRHEKPVIDVKIVDPTVLEAKEPTRETFAFKYTLSFLAASCAETSNLRIDCHQLIRFSILSVTYPLDLIKGRKA